MNVDAVLPGVGGGVVVVALGIITRFVLGWVAERRAGQAQDTANVSARVNDRATENAILLSTLEGLHKHNQSLQDRVSHLESVNARKDERIAQLESTVHDLRVKIDEVTVQLNEIKRLS